MNSSTAFRAAAPFLASLVFGIGVRSFAARIDLIEKLNGARLEGGPARAEALSQRTPYRTFPKQVAEYVSNVTAAVDPARSAFEMREAIGLAPGASVHWTLELMPQANLTAAVLLRGASAAKLRITWKPSGGAPSMWRDVTVPSTDAAARPQWVPFRAEIAGKASMGELSIQNVSRRSVWVGNPFIESVERVSDVPNVILIMVDTLTAEVVGHLGRPHGVTTNIDALAREGVTFENAITNANWTRPATIALLAGNYSSRLGINVNSWQLNPRARREAYASNPDTVPMLARRSGREAVAIGNNLFTMGYHAAGFDFGFTRIVDYRTEVRDTRDIVADVDHFLATRGSSPFFLYIALNAPHHPYVPPNEFLRMVKEVPGARLDPEVRRYLGEVAYTDDAIGRIARALDRTGLRRNTVFVVTADHGEGLREDNAYTNVVFDRPSRFTHTVNLYDEVVRIPLVVSGPQLARGHRVSAQVRILDVAATLGEIMAGVQSAKHIGRSLVPALKGHTIEARPAFTEGKRMSSVRAEGFKYIRREKGYDRLRPFGRDVVGTVPEELFNLRDDPREKRNLASSAPRELEKMRRLWSEMQEEVVGRSRAGVPSSAGRAPRSGANDLRPAATTILLGSDGTRHDLVGEIRTSGRFINWRLAAGEVGSGVWLSADNRLLISMVSMTAEAKLVVVTEPRDATIEVLVKADGRELSADAVRVGAFGLPLLGAGNMRFSGARLADLYAGRPPLVASGREHGVFIWRDGKPSIEATVAEDDKGEKLESGVESAMRAWGYIQSDKKAGLKVTTGNAGVRQKRGDLE